VNERKERRRLLKDKGALDKKKDHIEKSIQQGIASAKKTGDENRFVLDTFFPPSLSIDDICRQRMVKSRQKKLDDRFGIETSAKGTRFKLNRDLAGYHNSRKIELVMEDAESNVKIRLSDPPKLRTLGDLIHFDNVSYRFPKAKTALLEDVVFTVEQGGRCAFVGAVSPSSLSSIDPADSRIAERTR
jgi:ATP-binding cassette subfamily F protein 3